MTDSLDHDTGGQSVDVEGFTRETILDVLSNRRRRFALHVLKRRPGRSIALDELAERIACWENDTTVDELTYKQRKRVQNALHQYHLPKMADYGVVRYAADAGTVALTDRGVNSDFYLDVLPDRGLPWDTLYLALSAFGVVSVVGVWFKLFPFTLLSPMLWVGFLVTMLVLSSVGQFYDDRYRMRFGARDTPLEVENT